MKDNLKTRWPLVLAELVSRRLSVLAICVALVACAQPDPGVSKAELRNTPLEDCCDNAESFPQPLVHLAGPLAPVIGRFIGSVVMRDGYIARPAAYREVEAQLRPLDVLFVRSNGRLSSRMLPGFFSHAVIYLGSEAELTALGVWDDPTLKPYQSAIRAGRTYIESSTPDVHLSKTETVLATDAVAILRPPIKTRARKREALRDLARRIGSDFDFRFDTASKDKLFCAELAAQAMPEAGLPTRHLYGRQTILPDDVVALAVTGRGNMGFVGYVRGTKTGWNISDRKTLIVDMKSDWRATRPDPNRLEARNRH